jgi:hypothetical protein
MSTLILIINTNCLALADNIVELNYELIGGYGVISQASRSYNMGEVVPISVTPDFGYCVRAWHGTDNDSSRCLTNFVTMDSNKTVWVELASEISLRKFTVIPGKKRGLDEQVNGLIRQYLPKQTDLRYVTDDQLRFIMDRLNHRPRKTLGFKTPYEVFCNGSQFKTTRVALGS